MMRHRETVRAPHASESGLLNAECGMRIEAMCASRRHSATVVQNACDDMSAHGVSRGTRDAGDVFGKPLQGRHQRNACHEPFVPPLRGLDVHKPSPEPPRLTPWACMFRSGRARKNILASAMNLLVCNPEIQRNDLSLLLPQVLYVSVSSFPDLSLPHHLVWDGPLGTLRDK